jgi:5-methylcytosine-specific restriction endonuclease McrA
MGTLATPMGGAADPADFAQRILQIVNEGSLTSTYKLALLLSLIDVCMERTALDDRAAIPIPELASKIVDLYWQQTLPYPGIGTVLHQSGTAGQAKIISLIQHFRVLLEQGQPMSASQAKTLNPAGYLGLVNEIEEQLYRYVLLKLQTIGGAPDPFIYDLPPGADPRGQGSPRMFAGGLRLKHGAAVHLVRFEPLLRPLIQQRWAQHVAGLRANSMLSGVYELEAFLFGADRISLAPVTNALRDLQAGRCFYCRREVLRDRHVDHFIPWSRYRDNGLENLVFTDGACNERKHAYLAGLEHLDEWLDRFRPGTAAARDITSLGERLKWERQPSRTRGAAKTAYLYATPATLFWAHGTGLHREEPAAVRRVLSAA